LIIPCCVDTSHRHSVPTRRSSDLTTEAGGILDIVTHERTGLLVQCGDYEGMAREAIRLLHDENLADRIVNQAREECQKYSWEARSEEHTSELQSRVDLVCRLLLEK